MILLATAFSNTFQMLIRLRLSIKDLPLFLNIGIIFTVFSDRGNLTEEKDCLIRARLQNSRLFFRIYDELMGVCRLQIITEQKCSVTGSRKIDCLFLDVVKLLPKQFLLIWSPSNLWKNLWNSYWSCWQFHQHFSYSAHEVSKMQFSVIVMGECKTK